MADNDQRQVNYQQRYPKSWALLQLVNESGSQLQNYWIALLSLGSVLVAMIAGITDHDMFLGSPVKVPLVSAELPLNGFAIAAPLLILFLHAFVLAKYRLLMDTLNRLRSLERHRGNYDEDKHPGALEHYMGTSVLLRGLAYRGPVALTPAGITSFIAGFSIYLLPLLVLFLIQGWFLRYQSTVINFLLFVIILLDVLLCIYYFFSEPGKRLYKIVSYVVLTLSFLTIPVLYLHINYTGMRPYECVLVSSVNNDTSGGGVPKGKVADDNSDASWLWKQANFARFWLMSLNPSNRNFVDEELLNDVRGYDPPSLLLGRRNFAGANLSYANLQGVNLQNSNMRGAFLLRARLDDATTIDADFSHTCLKEATFVRSQMDPTDLQHARLMRADLTGADLKEADLSDADLTEAHLDGANLKLANLYDADLSRTRLIGASLKDANLEKVTDDQTSFLAADIRRAKGKSDLSNGLGEHVDYKVLRRHMCLSGTYPYVASQIIHSGLLESSLSEELSSKTAKFILEHRCTSICPGARQLERTTLSHLWRIASKRPDNFSYLISYSDHEMPDLFVDCKVLRAYFKLDAKKDDKATEEKGDD
ncbi:pentapeptide repeat-containing protein [Nitratireductor sp. XY-223]|uniref:pentapeptide repeat-containing protein n=1 Tax=Nitratireductor sp. XY-223 TaxID=2561926 RepID=UPI0010AA0A43|nr:pentapeptide repeat-containing protein [Nitratireductor sp. XY-223]